MRTHISLSLGALLAISLIAPPAPAAAKTRHSVRGGVRAHPQSASFSVSGRFSGTIGGDIILDGVVYRLTTGASIYELGRGMLPPGTFISDRVIFLSGARQSNGMAVSSVIVRPADPVGLIGQGTSPFVHEQTDGSPQ